MRADHRIETELRAVKITPDYTKYAEGSVLMEMGDTKVLCTATVEENVPPHVRGTGRGWVTAEYSMLPRATTTRNRRDIAKLKIAPRSSEIQRLIGRALRASIDLSLLGERSIVIDCDVLQADGGTRTASITGGYTALALAVKTLYEKGMLKGQPLRACVAAVSVGIVDGIPVADLCYEEDSRADVDMNVVMDENGNFIEVQGTGEQGTFDRAALGEMLTLAENGIRELIQKQKEVVDFNAFQQPEAPQPFVIASHNKGKIKEISDLLTQHHIPSIPQAEAGCEIEPEETGATFEENALIKARAVCKETGKPAMADDSGLEVMALGNQPGIYSARYAGEDASDLERIEKLLENMADLSLSERGARFVSALALAMPDGREFVVRGECYGIITERPEGQLGFGYDPVFFYPEYQKTFGQLDQNTKNAISHRAHSMELFAKALPGFLSGEDK